MNSTPTLQEGRLWSSLPRYQTRSTMDIIRKRVDLDAPDGWQDAAEMLSIYADPRYETARYIVVTNNRVSDHIAISSQIPSFTSVYPHTWMVDRLARDLEKDNSYLLFMHNHPSGLVAPSENDIKITNFLHAQFMDKGGKSRFLGHIIVGGNSMASFVKGNGDKWMGINGYDVMDMADLPNRPNYTKGMNVLGSLGNVLLPDYARRIADQSGIDTDKSSIILYTNVAGYVTGAKSVLNKDLYYNPKTLGPDLETDGRETGAANAHLVMFREDRELFRMVLSHNSRFQQLSNAIMTTREGGSLNLPEGERHKPIFKSGTTVPLKIEDTREIRKKLRQKPQHSHKGGDYGMGY